MARDYYETTIAVPDATGVIKALSGVTVTLVPRGTPDAGVDAAAQPLYQSDIGIARGPDPRSGATGTDVITTGTSGSVRFWADGPAEYDVVFKDTVVPARINDRVGWNCVPAKLGAIPTKWLAEDGGLTLKMLADEIKRQQVPVGTVLEWWRPTSIVPAPDGYEIADGHQATQHDFQGVSGPVNTPDLRGLFIVGADITKGDGTGAAQAAGVAGAPGIRGTGGSNLAKNLAHGHGVPGVDHLHLNTVPLHTHVPGSLYTGNHSHSVSVSGATGTGTRGAVMQLGGSAEAGTFLNHIHGFSGSGSTSVAGNLGIGGATGYQAEGAQQFWSGAADRSLNTATNSTTWTSDPGSDFRPQFYGLLRIIKVRRA